MEGNWFKSTPSVVLLVFVSSPEALEVQASRERASRFDDIALDEARSATRAAW